MVTSCFQGNRIETSFPLIGSLVEAQGSFVDPQQMSKKFLFTNKDFLSNCLCLIKSV